MSKTYTSGVLKRKAAPRSEKLRGLGSSSGETTKMTTVTPSGGGLTSVGLTPPAGFEVENSPLTSNGAIVLKYASGYSLPTTEKQDEWDDAVEKEHEHANGSVLDDITAGKVDNWDEAVTNSTNAIKHDGGSNAVHTIVVCTSYPTTRDANTLYILVNS